MIIYFGENLKRLRKEKELTQETLADFLGVTFQTISKWERCETYPDITMLPTVARFFGVSVDYLIGVDKMENMQKINEYLKLYETMKLKDRHLVLSELQKGVKEFPGEFSILIRYMELLTEEKDFPNKPDYDKTSKVLMEIYGKIQNHCTDDSIRIWSKRLICQHLVKKFQCTVGEDGKYWYCTEYLTKAESIINEMPSLGDSREMLSMMLAVDTVSHNKTHKKAIDELLHLLQDTIIGYCYYSDSFTPMFKIEVINNLNSLFHLMNPDDDFGKSYMHIVYNYGRLGHLYFEAGDKENAIKHLKIAAEYAKKLDEQPELSQRAALFYETETVFRNMNMCTRMALLMQRYYKSLSEEFKQTPEFKEIIDILGNPDIEDIVIA